LAFLRERACYTAQKYFDNKIYIRGLIEFTNYCKNDCYYCGIRRSNKEVVRYRLSREEILNCADTGYSLGFRTFVLQGGEDPYYTDDFLEDLIKSIKSKYPDCAITLSIGEKSFDSYVRLFKAGADRYLLRHETANEEHYMKLHPPGLSLQNRKQCLANLKNIGYQVGAGFMVGSPYQTVDNIIEDLLFIKELNPHMVGIGPFIPHHQTPFSNEAAGSLRLTLMLLSIIRLMLPNVLLPATTALGTLHPEGREIGILSGANVVMPNLSPTYVRKNYELYDNKICTGDEAAECRFCLERRINRIGYRIVVDRGDYRPINMS
ncbi:MAG TPA: [FeFe] hydrogenase H-cluster radical SAM maturase HydE, partial [Mobilitalea sp.]|nr:[FeFe] hydrogenase H-cluster radical SAM maturase HydE [Mobilitalea sp.]